MQFVKPDVLPLPLNCLENLHQKIEYCGRICYKSESDYTEEGAKKFIERIIKRGHLSVLEHYRMRVKFNSFSDMQKYGELRQLILNSSSRRYLDTVDSVNPTEGKIAAYDSITGNARAFLEFINAHTAAEHSIVMLLSNILHMQVSDVIFPYFSDITISGNNITVIEDPDYATFHIITDRGVLCELTRHRTMSFSVESTRYCNYVNKGMTFCLPYPYDVAKEIEYFMDKKNNNQEVPSQRHNCMAGSILAMATHAEEFYNQAISNGVAPQEARMLLPHMLKTEIIMSGPLSEWEHVLSLRCAPDAHPQCKYIADKIMALFYI